MRALLVLTCSLLCALPAQAQESAYPDKPVRIVVPFPPGGTSDSLTRTLGQELGRMWGHAVIVENRPGAGGGVGAGHVARSAPDGYTLFMGSSAPLVVQPHLVDKLPFDPQRDFAPVSFVADVQNMLVVSPALGVDSVASLIEVARTRKPSLTFASNGNGSSPHMSAELFKKLAHVQMTHVPYKGSSPAMAALLGGQIDLMFDNLPTAIPQARSGSVKALAVTGARRSPSMPELPTVAEAGLPGFATTVWYGLLAPAGTPPAVLEKISRDVGKAMTVPQIRQALIDLGTEPSSSTPAEFAAFMQAERDKWGKLIAEAGIKPE